MNISNCALVLITFIILVFMFLVLKPRRRYRGGITVPSLTQPLPSKNNTLIVMIGNMPSGENAVVWKNFIKDAEHTNPGELYFAFHPMGVNGAWDEGQVTDIKNEWNPFFAPNHLMICDKAHWVTTRWGNVSLTYATIMAMQFALSETPITRFNNSFYRKIVFLQQGVPIWPFSYIQQELVKDNKSWIKSRPYSRRIPQFIKPYNFQRHDLNKIGGVTRGEVVICDNSQTINIKSEPKEIAKYNTNYKIGDTLKDGNGQIFEKATINGPIITKLGTTKIENYSTYVTDTDVIFIKMPKRNEELQTIQMISDSNCDDFMNANIIYRGSDNVNIVVQEWGIECITGSGRKAQVADFIKNLEGYEKNILAYDIVSSLVCANNLGNPLFYLDLKLEQILYRCLPDNNIRFMIADLELVPEYNTLSQSGVTFPTPWRNTRVPETNLQWVPVPNQINQLWEIGALLYQLKVMAASEHPPLLLLRQDKARHPDASIKSLLDFAKSINGPEGSYDNIINKCFFTYNNISEVFFDINKLVYKVDNSSKDPDIEESYFANLNDVNEIGGIDDWSWSSAILSIDRNHIPIYFDEGKTTWTPGGTFVCRGITFIDIQTDNLIMQQYKNMIVGNWEYQWSHKLSKDELKASCVNSDENMLSVALKSYYSVKDIGMQVRILDKNKVNSNASKNYFTNRLKPIRSLLNEYQLQTMTLNQFLYTGVPPPKNNEIYSGTFADLNQYYYYIPRVIFWRNMISNQSNYPIYRGLDVRYNSEYIMLNQIRTRPYKMDFASDCTWTNKYPCSKAHPKGISDQSYRDCCTLLYQNQYVWWGNQMIFRKDWKSLDNSLGKLFQSGKVKFDSEERWLRIKNPTPIDYNKNLTYQAISYHDWSSITIDPVNIARDVKLGDMEGTALYNYIKNTPTRDFYDGIQSLKLVESSQRLMYHPAEYYTISLRAIVNIYNFILKMMKFRTKSSCAFYNASDCGWTKNYPCPDDDNPLNLPTAKDDGSKAYECCCRDENQPKYSVYGGSGGDDGTLYGDTPDGTHGLYGNDQINSTWGMRGPESYLLIAMFFYETLLLKFTNYITKIQDQYHWTIILKDESIGDLEVGSCVTPDILSAARTSGSLFIRKSVPGSKIDLYTDQILNRNLPVTSRGNVEGSEWAFMPQTFTNSSNAMRLGWYWNPPPPPPPPPQPITPVPGLLYDPGIFPDEYYKSIHERLREERNRKIKNRDTIGLFKSQ